MKNKVKIITTICCIILLGLTFAACGAPSAPSFDENKKDVVLSAERKIVYSIYFSITTKDTKKAISKIEASLLDDEWFDETSYSDSGAYFVIRVNTQRLDAYVSSILADMAEDSVSNYRKTAHDISIDYYEKQGLIDSLETERARLLEFMQDETTSIGDLIQISTRLSQVEYELAKLRGELYVFDSQVDYSTVTISVREYSYAWIAPIVIFGTLAIVGSVVVILQVKKSKKQKQNPSYPNNRAGNYAPPPQSPLPPPNYNNHNQF